MTRIPMTAEGFARLQDELRRLKTVDRLAVARALEEARSHGDIAENAEFHAAKERQSFVEGRVAELEDKLRRAQIIEVNRLSGETVTFGATVRIAEETSGEETEYRIVGADEAEVKRGLLSVTSPIAQALIGKSAGDLVEVTTPRGTKVYVILVVKFE